MRILSEHKPFVTIQTPLGHVPRMWLELIEPKILRVDGCWLWADKLGPRNCAVNGEPRIIVQGTPVLVKNLVVEIFYPHAQVRGKDRKHHVFHACGNKTCIHPGHLLVTLDLPTQVSMAHIVKTRRKNLIVHRAEWRRRNADPEP